ncbi:MAG: hypothetical protein LH480_03805 [Rubrivivax sp.]|nr:hypothetical protein [Rubrivivax sp.]
MRCSESARFLSGILPMSMAVIASTLAPALRFVLSADSSAARMPVMLMTWAAGAAAGAGAEAAGAGAGGAAVWAWA